MWSVVYHECDFFLSYLRQEHIVPLTSEAGSVGGIHGDHGLGHTGRTAGSGLVQGPHPEDVGAALYQSCDGEAGVLHWDVIALSPVVGAHLTPVVQTQAFGLVSYYILCL